MSPAVSVEGLSFAVTGQTLCIFSPSVRHSGPRIEYGAGFDPESRSLYNQRQSLSLAFLDSRLRGKDGLRARDTVRGLSQR